MGQRETILRMLEDAGDRGVTSRQFVDANIFRYSARIEELRKQGFEIATQRREFAEGRGEVTHNFSAPIGGRA